MLQQETILKQEINDIIEAGTLEIQLRFMDFEIAMEIIDTKSHLFESYHFHNIGKHLLAKPIINGEFTTEIKTDLLIYILNL